DKGVTDSGCSRHMTRNISFLLDFKEIDRGYVSFEGNPKGGKISGKGKIKTGKLDFDDVYFVKELKFNLFNVSQMCDKKNSVLFIDTKCVVLSSNIKLPDDNHVLLRVPRENNMRLGHINFKTMNKPVKGNLVRGNQLNDNAGIKENLNAGKVEKETIFAQQYVLPPFWSLVDSPTGVKDLRAKFEEFSFNSTNRVNAVSVPVNAVEPNLTNSTNSFNIASPSVNDVSPNIRIAEKSSFLNPSKYPDDSDMPELEDIVYSDDGEDVGAEADLSNLKTNILVSLIPTTRVHKDYHVNQIIGDLNSAPQTRNMIRMVKEQGRLHQINDKDFHTCMFACFLSQEEPKKVHQALKDPSWIESMQEELLQLKMQKVWVLVDLPKGKRAVGLKWVFRNKKDKRGIVIRNKARLVGQGHTQEEGIDFDEVFAPVARIKAIWLFLAYASFMGFMVYQMDVKSAFLYGTIEEEVYICQPSGFKDLDYPDKVYKMVKTLHGLHQAPKAWKFGFTCVKSASTPIETKKPLLKDPGGEDVDVHVYRLMIGSLMYLTSSRLAIMFAVYACA
nr:putative ribonuclease H-like domain-containing protein [Tanacetum cinerariifolium]